MESGCALSGAGLLSPVLALVPSSGRSFKYLEPEQGGTLRTSAQSPLPLSSISLGKVPSTRT